MPDALLRVFISYARADSKDFVDRLEQDLKARQFDPWVDRHGLEGGDEWMEIIQDAIDQCQALVVVVSPAAVQSQYVRMEYRYASSQGKLIIPAKHLSTPRPPHWHGARLFCLCGRDLYEHSSHRALVKEIMPARVVDARLQA